MSMRVILSLVILMLLACMRDNGTETAKKLFIPASNGIQPNIISLEATTLMQGWMREKGLSKATMASPVKTAAGLVDAISREKRGPDLDFFAYKQGSLPCGQNTLL